MSATPPVLQSYVSNGWRLVFWPQIGDDKGPKGTAAKGWTTRQYTLTDYKDGYRVGIVTGQEVSPGKFLHDVDIDWAPGSLIAQQLLPSTNFVFGHASKKVSHCFYLLPQALPTFKYEDVDKTSLIEIRGTKNDGEIGFQTMAPPSVWTKDGVSEPLAFVKNGVPTFLEPAGLLKQRVCLAAIGMLLAKHLGLHGFGHDPRLAWAGFLLRAGIPVDDLVTMGEAISVHCHNTEIADVRRVVESTASALKAENKKVKGGPSLARLLGTSGKAIISRINEWLGRDSDFIRSPDGLVLKDNQENIKRAIALLGHELSYDEFSDKLLIDRKYPLEDRHVNDLWLRVDEEYRFRPTFTFFEKVIKRAGWDNAFHPVKDYLDGLTWDGTPRLDTWLVESAGATDSDYLRAVSSIVLIAAVRRIRQPGCKYDELLVLEGEQGLNKSSALRALCPKPEWFSDDLPLNITSQRMIESTVGKWIIEAADLAGKRKTEVDQLKSTLSRQVDGPARMAYAHLPVERPRQFVILGTTNSAAYLTDPTGARRFWPVAIQAFNVPLILSWRDQLWAEAAKREAGGESIRLREELWPHALQHQEARREIDPWENTIRDFLVGLTAGADGVRRLATNEVWDTLGIAMERRDRGSALRLSEIMQRLGFKRTRVRIAGVGLQVGFVQVKLDALDLAEPDDGATVERVPGQDDDPF